MSEPINEALLIDQMVGAIGDILAAQDPEIQGMVLADLLATWIGGHSVPGDPEATADFRAEMLDLHVKAVCNLMEIDEHVAAE